METKPFVDEGTESDGFEHGRNASQFTLRRESPAAQSGRGRLGGPARPAGARTFWTGALVAGVRIGHALVAF